MAKLWIAGGSLLLAAVMLTLWFSLRSEEKTTILGQFPLDSQQQHIWPSEFTSVAYRANNTDDFPPRTQMDEKRICGARLYEQEF